MSQPGPSTTLRPCRWPALLGHSLLEDITDDHGVVHPVTLVTDGGSAFKSIQFARFIGLRPEFEHVRTRDSGDDGIWPNTIWQWNDIDGLRVTPDGSLVILGRSA